MSMGFLIIFFILYITYIYSNVFPKIDISPFSNNLIYNIEVNDQSIFKNFNEKNYFTNVVSKLKLEFKIDKNAFVNSIYARKRSGLSFEQVAQNETLDINKNNYITNLRFSFLNKESVSEAASMFEVNVSNFNLSECGISIPIPIKLKSEDMISNPNLLLNCIDLFNEKFEFDKLADDITARIIDYNTLGFNENDINRIIKKECIINKIFEKQECNYYFLNNNKIEKIDLENFKSESPTYIILIDSKFWNVKYSAFNFILSS